MSTPDCQDPSGANTVPVMTATLAEDKGRENYLRQVARRQGLSLHKSRRRDPRAIDYGAYWVTDDHGEIVAGDVLGRGARDLDAVAMWLEDGHLARHLQLTERQPGACPGRGQCAC